MTKALVIFSGGMDSTTLLAHATFKYDEVEAVSFHYGQTHAVELEQAVQITKLFNVHHELIRLPAIFGGAGSALIDSDDAVDMPEGDYREITPASGPSPTVVPFRNANLISMATTVAIRRGCDLILTGVHAEDSAGWAYPDCTPEFIGAMANAVFVGSYQAVRLEAPFQYSSKGDIVKLGMDLRWHISQMGEAWALSHSCYKGRRPACGVCPTCIGRIQAFKEAGLIDPTEYQIAVDWS